MPRARAFSHSDPKVFPRFGPLSRLFLSSFWLFGDNRPPQCENDSSVLQPSGADKLGLTPVHDPCLGARDYPSTFFIGNCVTRPQHSGLFALEPNFGLHNSCGARLARPSRARLGISVRKNFEPGWPLDISQRPFSNLALPGLVYLAGPLGSNPKLNQPIRT